MFVDDEKVDKVEEPKQDDPKQEDPKPDPVAERLEKLEQELGSLRRENSELKGGMEFYHRQLQSKTPAPAADDEPKTDVDLVEAISSGDTKAVRKALSDLGYVSKADVDRKIAETRDQIVSEAKFFSDFPDLQNESSPLFQAAKKHYREFVADGLPQDKALKAAAKIAKAEIAAQAAPAKETEEERAARVAAQSGARKTSTGDEGGNDTLSARQRAIAASMGISEEAYAKRAKSGVNMVAKRN